MTDPTGRSFLSYRRSRTEEAALLIAAQHDRGIPTWQDITNLDSQPLNDELRNVLENQEVANAILWLTPDFSASPIIQRVEAPIIFTRTSNKDSFFIVPVLAGGMNYSDAQSVIDPVYSYEDLSMWNLRKVSNNPIDHKDAVKVANWVLHQRIKTIHKSLAPGEPLQVELNTRKKLQWQTGKALLLDWVARFDDRLAKPNAWEKYLLPALEDVAQAIEQNAVGRKIEASGLIALPAAISFGSCFRATRMRHNPLTWRQYTPGREDQYWGINEPYKKESSGFQAVTREYETSSDTVAVLVSVNGDVEPAFQVTKKTLPALRGIIRVTKAGDMPHDLETPEQALDLAHLIVNAINQARSEFRVITCVHLFMAVPAGLAMIVGQLLNKIPAVQTYELISIDGVNQYQPATLLHPSD